MSVDSGTCSSVPVKKRSTSLVPDSHVHFKESELTPEHAGEITIEVKSSTRQAEAHIGFLQIGRRYEIVLNLQYYLGSEVSVAQLNPNLSVKTIEALPGHHTGHKLTLELTTSHEKLLSEHVELVNSKGEKFGLILLARVLGKGKGTPMLKSGIHCVEVISVDSDISDYSEDSTLPQQLIPAAAERIPHTIKE